MGEALKERTNDANGDGKEGANGDGKENTTNLAPAPRQPAAHPAAQPAAPPPARGGIRTRGVIGALGCVDTREGIVLQTLGASREEDRALARRLHAITRRLGGRFVESKEFDAECSHMIVVQLKRSEKLLGQLAAGRWLLSPSWVDASEAKGSWAHEAEHELSEAGAGCFELPTGSLWHGAALAHRRHREQRNTRCFEAWRFLVADGTSPNRKTLKRILEAGGAAISTHPESELDQPPEGAGGGGQPTAQQTVVVVPSHEHAWRQLALSRGMRCLLPTEVIELITNPNISNELGDRC